MIVTVAKKFKFHSAHFLPPGISSKCENLHGHTYHGTLYLKGEVNSKGILVEAGALSEGIEEVISEIDHATITRFNPEQPMYSEGLAREWAMIKPLYDFRNKLYIFNLVSTVENLAPHLAERFVEQIFMSVPIEEGSYSLWVTLYETPTFSVTTEEFKFKIWYEPINEEYVLTEGEDVS